MAARDRERFASIRAEHGKGVLAYKALAEVYGVSTFGIQYAIRGRSITCPGA